MKLKSFVSKQPDMHLRKWHLQFMHRDREIQETFLFFGVDNRLQSSYRLYDYIVRSLNQLRTAGYDIPAYDVYTTINIVSLNYFKPFAKHLLNTLHIEDGMIHSLRLTNLDDKTKEPMPLEAFVDLLQTLVE